MNTELYYAKEVIKHLFPNIDEQKQIEKANILFKEIYNIDLLDILKEKKQIIIRNKKNIDDVLPGYNKLTEEGKRKSSFTISQIAVLFSNKLKDTVLNAKEMNLLLEKLDYQTRNYVEKSSLHKGQKSLKWSLTEKGIPFASNVVVGSQPVPVKTILWNESIIYELLKHIDIDEIIDSLYF